MLLSLQVSQKKSCQKIMKDYFSKIRVPMHNNIQAKFKQQKNPLLYAIQPTLKSRSSVQKTKMKIKQSRSTSFYQNNRQPQSRYIKQKNEQLLKSLQIVKSQIKQQANKNRHAQLHLPRKKIYSLRQLNYEKNKSFLRGNKMKSDSTIKINQKIFIQQCTNAEIISKNQPLYTHQHKNYREKQQIYSQFSQIPQSQRYLTLTTQRPRTSSDLLRPKELFQRGFYKFQALRNTRYQFESKIEGNRNQRIQQILNGWEVHSPRDYN